VRYSAEHKQETRARILAAAGQVFRKEGYGGAGIDALTKAAGVTNGAFYNHFTSKGEAFRIVVLEGLQALRGSISELKAYWPKDWVTAFAAYSMGYRRTCDLGGSCALPSLSPDVIRADLETRQAYTEALRRIIEDTAEGLTGERSDREDRAIALLALLSGGVTLARAVSDPELSERIAQAIERAAPGIANAENGADS